MIGVAWVEFKTKSDFESAAAAEPADEAFEESEADLAASGVVEAILRDFVERTSDCLKTVDKREWVNFLNIFGLIYGSSWVFSRFCGYLGVSKLFRGFQLFRGFC